VFSLFDTRLGEVTEIRPAAAGLLRMLSCGSPLDRDAHLGDLRAFLLADLIRRNGERRGLSVIVCQPVCDLGRTADERELEPAGEDGPLAGTSAQPQLPPQARSYEEAVRSDCIALNIAPPDYAPRASESVGQVVDLITKLIEAGHAYLAESGSVYFDAASYPGHAASPGATVPGSGSGNDGAGKRSAADWPLWTAARSDAEPTFTAPWGAGQPTCHATCSALSLECLGNVIDVHVGDAAHRLDWDEKERAQSDSLAGRAVVRHRVHCAAALFDDGPVRLGDLAERGLDPLAARLGYLEHSYRERVTLTWSAFAAADTALRGLRELVADWATEPSKPMCADYTARIQGALDHDLDTPAALHALHELAADSQVPAGSKFETFAAADRVLGLELTSLVGQRRS
jgi:cysteinyl-tRNA synthetase